MSTQSLSLSRFLRFSGGLFAIVLAVLLSGVLLLALPSTTARAQSPTKDASQAAAGWLARQMVEGNHFESEYEGEKFPDQGLTIDAVIAFAASGVADEYSDNAMSWLAQPSVLKGYIGDGSWLSAGAHAKALYAVLVTGRNPSSFGGVDLIKELLTRKSDSGRFSDFSSFPNPTDYSNAIGQSFALLALSRTDAGSPVDAVSFLAGTQCPNGGFPLKFGQASCVSDVDATAYVTQALRATGSYDKASQGLNWLAIQQNANGAFGDTTSGVVNANSTGIAAQALKAGGFSDSATKAVAFLHALQVGCAGVVENQGAVAYSESGFDTATAPRATAQAILGIAGVPLEHIVNNGTREAPTLDCSTTPSPEPTPTATTTTVNAGGTAGGKRLPNTGNAASGILVAGCAVFAVGVGAVFFARRTRELASRVGG